jgi:hypothetical protein
MTKQTGLGDSLFVDGIDISGDTQMLGNISGGPVALDHTPINKRAFERLGGLRNGNMDLTSFWNTTGAHLAWRDLPRTDRILTYLRGSGIGSPAACLVGKQIGYDGNRGADGMFTLGVNAQSNGFALEWGEQLTAGKRSDTAATNGSSLDYGVDIGTTAFGLQLYVHLFSFTGTSVTIKVQESSDNAGADPFADVTGATSGALTAVGAVRAQTSRTANIERYLRIVTTGTFSEATFCAVVVKNLSSVVF